MSGSQSDEKIKAKVSQVIVLRRSAEHAAAASTDAVPDTLYLHVSGNVEWSFFSGHAWGTASVSRDRAGRRRYRVARLELRIEMRTPETQRQTQTGRNSSKVDGDVVWYSTGGGQTSGPRSIFRATASDPNYGTWSTSCSVY